jgi:hypothetical protein
MKSQEQRLTVARWDSISARNIELRRPQTETQGVFVDVTLVLTAKSAEGEI